MTLPPEYFQYEHRRPGLDHTWFKHRNLPQAAPLAWPGNKRIALWIAVHVQHFPMDMPSTPFNPPGGMERPYPSYWDYTRRDYGNRVGIFRLMRALDAAGLRATAVMNAAVAGRYPVLAQEIARHRWDVIAAGLDMGHLHHGGLGIEQERDQVMRARDILRTAFGPGVTGWHSPAHSESMNTLDLVAAAGFDHVADWVNDDLPFPIETRAGPLTALPLAWELSDQRVLLQQHQSTGDFVDAVHRAHRQMLAESETGGGRILAVTLTPWVAGQPHRMPAIAQLLQTLANHPESWNATAQDILACGPTHAT